MKILLLGKDGQVGWELQRALATAGELLAMGRADVDLEDADRLKHTVRDLAPDVIVNAAAYTSVDKAESEPERARRVNAIAVAALAEEAHRLKAWLVHYSTDYVFDGRKSLPYTVDDETGPLSVYGRTKLDGEYAIRNRHDAYLIFRTSWVYGARGSNFPKTMLRLAGEREHLTVVGDQQGAPTGAELIADVTALALYRLRTGCTKSKELSGIYHLAAQGRTTWCDYARFVIAHAHEKGATLKAGADDVEAIATEAYPTPAARPRNSLLDTAKLCAAFEVQMPDWKSGVARLVDQLKTQGFA